ncbi:hypothetical protein EYF80_035490 [Liparis tanakae]|uniref:Uncharacterized protein n=1 Tax=Liparis tanakae TaxID=230148 RepID=A0A4Z2GNM6_9TELE|nr:hypothetical protein EYF80_035490 [Liparis tanakae]
MARFEGVVGVIFITQRHLAKSAPSFLYWAQRSYSPSSPVEEGERTQGDDTFVDLDAHHHVSSLEVLGEDLSVVGLLVHGLMEEDDATNARVDAVIGGEEELAGTSERFMCYQTLFPTHNMQRHGEIRCQRAFHPPLWLTTLENS